MTQVNLYILGIQKMIIVIEPFCMWSASDQMRSLNVRIGNMPKQITAVSEKILNNDQNWGRNS